ncbi:phosphoribosyl-AMP cyclohydrolase [Ensifer aridi]|uniref:phosphoribosyl-AMP cyclohydrolase n=1 Tax=Ensifer aridi TaxID=1708715 RepID=UPI000411BDF1|nr:phosphoribosyl-AMP cyclohydrolase [Ensifer aridi]
MTLTFDSPPEDKAELETGSAFTPRFDEKGLITAIVTDAGDGELLMVAHMNADALALTIETGVAHYYSRSRGRLWKKGESSGNLQTVKEIRTDCDQDAVWLKVSVAGHDATCHTGRRSCFYRTVGLDNGKATVTITDDHRHFDPAEIYAKN